ncbi:MAG: hypothetical protein QOF76_5649 [Solirubrobacteraceae bacterium]|jgi:hypothetical protein|nr:hypothetical protein [Solirubrobacteraceae bacterium]
MVTTALSPLGPTAAASVWLFIARFSGLLAVLLTYALARRLGGRVAGLIAAATLLLATEFLFNVVRGDSEGLLVALTFGAILAQLDGHPRAALLIGFAAGLLRPEVWPLIGLHGVWVVHTSRRSTTALLVIGGGIAMVALWIVPELIGSGDALRAASRAQNPVTGSPGSRAFPFGATFANASGALWWPAYAGALAAVAQAYRARPRDRTVLVIAAGATLQMVTVAALAQLGTTGNLRYVTLPFAGLCVLGGIGLTLLWRAIWRAGILRWTALLLIPTAAAGLVVQIADAANQAHVLANNEDIYGHELPRLIRAAGGPSAIRKCGPVSTTPFARQALARRLDLTQESVHTSPMQTGTFLGRPGRTARQTGLPVRLRTATFVLRSSCRLG